MGAWLVRGLKTLFAASRELRVAGAGGVGEALLAAEKDSDLLGALAAASADGFGCGAAMAVCRFPGDADSVGPASETAAGRLALVAGAVNPVVFRQSVGPSPLPMALGCNVPLTVSVAQTAGQIIIMCQTLSSSTLSVAASANQVVITMTFPEEAKIQAELDADPSCVVLGAQEFFGPVVRTVALPVQIDPTSKIMVYDRNDGIVSIRYDVV